MSESTIARRIERALCEYDESAGRWITHSLDSGACRWCDRSTRSLAYAAGFDV